MPSCKVETKGGCEPPPETRTRAVELGAHPLGNHLLSLDVSDTALVVPKRFSERSFVQYVARLCDAGKHEAAALYLVQNVHELLASNLNPKEKLNHLLFLPRIIQRGAATKHGYPKVLLKASAVEHFTGGLELSAGGSFIELGCGAYDPLAMSTYYYLNGFESCFGVDLLPPRNERYSAISMYDILSNVRSFPKDYCRAGSKPRDILQRLNHFALKAFERGNFWGGFRKVRDSIRLEEADIAKANIPQSSASLIVSFDVLEHVADITQICERLYQLLKPGGVVFNFVDLADHRVYRGDPKFGPLSFLADEDVPRNMNRLRAHEIAEAHRRAGFEILHDVRAKAKMPDWVLQNLQPRFRNMSVEDLSAIGQTLLARRPIQ